MKWREICSSAKTQGRGGAYMTELPDFVTPNICTIGTGPTFEPGMPAIGSPR